MSAAPWLTEAERNEITRLRNTSCPCCGRKPTVQSIAEKFGVHPSVVSYHAQTPYKKSIGAKARGR